MPVVAGFFDTEAAATSAMDQLMHMRDFEDVETEVITTIARGTDSEPGVRGVVPFMPQTSGGAGGGYVTPGGPIPVTGHGREMFNELDDEEANYFRSALENGGVLALVKVDKDQAHTVRQIFNQHGARTHQDD